MKTTIAVLLALLAISCQNKKDTDSIDPYDYSSVKRIVVKNGAVASAHPLSSSIGAAIFKEGGNAIDAAIATQLALAVVYPSAGNVGGGGFTVIHLANGKNTTIDYREKAPGHASRNMYLDKNGHVIPRASRDGNLAVGVPGTVAGIFLAHEEYGKLPMKVLIQPAINLAKDGFVITADEARRLNAYQEDFKAFNTVQPVFVKSGEWRAGDTLVQTDLARTLELIRDQGKAGFYAGETAKKIVAEIKRGNGLITLVDLKNYQAVEREPVSFDYKGYTLVSMPPPSSGGVLLRQMLSMLKNYPVGTYGFESVRAVQLMTEIERRAFADRATYLGDPDFIKIPLQTMVSDTYLQKRMADYNPDAATPSKDIQAGVILPESHETTHISVVDSAGNAVAVTYTLNGLYGSRVVVGHAGFFLNNEMDDFSAKPGAPNKNGLVGAEANAIVPGKRMLSSMSPTIVLKGNKPYLVLGTPGSATIITSVFQTIVNILDFNMSVSDAVNKPKFHHQWKPDLIDIENGFPDSVVLKLKKMGYSIRELNSIGRTEVIKIDGDSIEAVADSRGDDSADGY